MAISSLTRNRITGLVSGFDTESIIRSMMQIQQLKVDRQYKAMKKIEWKGDAYRELNNKLRTFRETNFSVGKQDNNMLSALNFKIFTVDSDDKSGALSATADQNVALGSVQVKKITSVASGASIASDALTNGKGLSLTTQIKDLELGTADASGSFSINGVTFYYSDDNTLDEIFKTVNESELAGVTMSYSEHRDQIIITSKETGAESEVEFKNISGNFASLMKINTDAAGVATAQGTNAVIVFNIGGTEYTVERSTNTFTLDGVNYTVRNTTDQVINLTIKQDITAAVDKVKTFVENFNELLSSLKTQYNEKLYRAYDPLTDDERNAVTEKEAEQLESFAKSGLLRYDNYLGSLMSNMRMAFYEPIEGIGLSLADIGVSMGDTRIASERDKLVLDEEKLREALQSNPDQVAEMFTRKAVNTDYSFNSEHSGVMQRLNQMFIDHTSVTQDTVISQSETNLYNATKRYDDMLAKLYEYEESLWKKFTAMEKALANLNSQSNWITQMLSGSSSQ